MARLLRELAAFSRLILFDKRGTGLSDRHVGVATLEDRIDDIRAVLDAVGSKQAVLFGTADGAPMSALFAVTYPDRTSGLILWGGITRGLWAPDFEGRFSPSRVSSSRMGTYMAPTDTDATVR